MTLPHEEILAVSNVERFLLDLVDPKKTPNVPSKIRREAISLLKHYPRDVAKIIHSREERNDP